MPSRDARLHAVPLVVAVDALLEVLDELRALGSRPDDAHLAAEDVEELRQLVDRRRAQERADARSAVVALHAAGRRSATSGASTSPPAAPVIERNLSISNGRPSRPIRSWRKKIGRPIVNSTAAADGDENR